MKKQTERKKERKGNKSMKKQTERKKERKKGE